MMMIYIYIFIFIYNMITKIGNDEIKLYFVLQIDLSYIIGHQGILKNYKIIPSKDNLKFYIFKLHCYPLPNYSGPCDKISV